MTTSDRWKTTLTTILLTICIVLWGLGFAARVFRAVFPQKVDSAAQARAYESYLNWRESSSRLNDPFKRSPFDRSFTISPKVKADLAGTRVVINAFMGDIREDNLSAAYQRTSASFRKRMGQDDFETLICDHLELKEPSRWAGWANITYPNGSASQEIGADKTATTTLHFTMTNTGDRWEIDGLAIADKK